MSKAIPEIGQEFKFKGLSRKQADGCMPLSDWRVGDVVVVVAHVRMQGEMCALYWNEGHMSSSTVRPDLLEIIRTPTQLRESAIREVMDIAQVDCRVTAARLVDAGFKREGK